MTTYTLTGFSYYASSAASSGASLTGARTLRLFVPETSTSSFRYTNQSAASAAETPVAEIRDIPGAFYMMDDQSLPALSKLVLQEMTWTEGGESRTTTVLLVRLVAQSWDGEQETTGDVALFSLAGDPLPDPTTDAELVAFLAAITGFDTAGGDFAPDQDIAFSTLFSSSSENDFVVGTGEDTPHVRDDNIETGAGQDTVLGGDGNDVLSGGDGADWLSGQSGNDNLYGGSGDDWLVVSRGGSYLHGGAGFDSVVVDSWSGLHVRAVFARPDLPGRITLEAHDASDPDFGAIAIYTATTEEVEQVVIGDRSVTTAADYSAMTALIEGNSGHNYVRLDTIIDSFVFQGGGGTDQLDLEHLTYWDSAGVQQQGMSLEALLEMTYVVGSASSATFYYRADDTVFLTLTDVELLRLRDQNYNLILSLSDLLALPQATSGAPTGSTESPSAGNDTLSAVSSDAEGRISAEGGDDHLSGDSGADRFWGDSGADTLEGAAGGDSLVGGLGRDQLVGGAGNDTLIGGDNLRFFGGQSDLADQLYGGDGDDSLDGGYGNDELRGDAGNDTIVGGYGADFIVGGAGDDVLSGQAWSDEIFGGAGNDFINGGYGSDRLNGGAGADRFYHLGISDHGSDWIQDYDASEGDVLVFGTLDGSGLSDGEDFQVFFSESVGAGAAGVEEAFVVYMPTGDVIWALVDGADHNEIILRVGGVDYDLLA